MNARPTLAWPISGASPGQAPRALVLDSNIVLDLFVFADPHAAALRQLLGQGGLDWIATQAMRDELACVLRYAHLQPRLAFHGLDAAAVLAAFDAGARLVAAPARARYVCKDGDDQKFIDLAAAHAAVLLSKDKAVLRLTKRLATLGADVAAAIALA